MPDMPRRETQLLEATNLTEEQVAAIARDLWRSRGCPEGSPEQDWFEAEELIKVEDLKLGDQGQSGG